MKLLTNGLSKKTFRDIFLILFLIVALFYLLGCGVACFNKAVFSFLLVSSIFIFVFLKIEWSIYLFIFLCPFHYLLKIMLPYPFGDIWRELFFLCIVISWFFQVSMGKLPSPGKNILNGFIASYILWGLIQIFHSYHLLAGLAGFRYMFAFIPLYFIVLSVLKKRGHILRLINIILTSGVIIALIAIIQFSLVSILKIINPGTLIDFTRRYTPHVSIKPAGIPFERAISLFASPNELGSFLFVCLIFILVFYYYSYSYRKMYHKRAIFAIIAIFTGLLLSMSRSSLIALGVSVLTVSFIKKRKKLIFILVAGIILFSLIFPISITVLFKPVFSLTDASYAVWTGSNRWEPLLKAPLLGHGFFITRSVAEKLNLSQQGIINLGGIDSHFFETSIQIGLIGFFLHFIIWSLFLKHSYLSTRSHYLSEKYKSIALANFGVLLGFMVVGLHASPWEYVSLSANYYVFGAISTFIYLKAKKNMRGASREKS